MTPVEYTNWEPGEPNDYGDSEDCVESFMNPGRGWNDQECSDARHWICRIEKSKSLLTFICEVIKQNESYAGNIDFEIYPIIV